MKTAGIIAEYNPMHRGHGYHIEKTKEILGEDTGIICIMSGDFVQRGENAVFSKFARAEAACRAGADLVVELPLLWALSSAEGFARGGVSLLNALGAEYISFGSECGDIDAMEEAAQVLADPTVTEEIKALLKLEPNSSFPAAREKVLSMHNGSSAELLKSPNNILGVEYVKALYTLGSNMKPVTVRRIGSPHDSDDEDMPSASRLRSLLAKGESIAKYSPENAMEVYAREIESGRLVMPERLENAILSRLRMLDADAFEAVADAGNGLGLKLYAAARTEPGLGAVIEAAKSKRYTLSRIRRICVSTALGIRAEMSKGLPGYARVLAANKRGCEIIKSAAKKDRIPVITKPAAIRGLGQSNIDVFETGSRAHDLFVLGYENTEDRRGELDWKTSPIII